MPLGSFRLNSIGKIGTLLRGTAKPITAVGNAQVSTAQSKFGGASGLFDGAGSPVDCLTTPANTDFAHGTGNFTYEAWIYPTARGTFPTVFGATSASFGLQSSGYLFAFIGGSGRTGSATAATLNAWNHVAYTRSGGTLRMFLNGTQVFTQSITTSMASSSNMIIGNDGGTSFGFVGYIDEVRISANARYTANFTPSTVPFVNDANTRLLIHANGDNGSTSFTDDN
jgi:hypothetical protein